MTDKRATPSLEASRHAWLTAGAPILGLVLFVSMLAVLLLLSFAREQDRDYATGTQHLVHNVLEGRGRALGALTIDYANWQAAYDHASPRFSSAWFEESFYSSVVDALIVFRPGESPRYVWFMDEAPVNVTMQVIDAASRIPNLSTLAGAEQSPDGVANTFATVDGRLAIISTAPITPEDDAERRALAGRTDTYYLVAVQFLDSPRAEALGHNLSMPDMAFGTDTSPDRIAHPIVGADGAQVGVLSWTHPHPGEKGLMSRLWIVIAGLALAGFLTVLIARKLVQRQVGSLVRAESAVESSRLKAEFIATMSHELRTPLNAIIGYAELIEEECEALGPEGATLREDSARIIAAGRHLSRLVSDLLDQSRLDAGRLSLHIETVHAGELLAEIGEIAEPLTAVQGSRLVIGESDEVVLADHARIRQCLLNLVTNASRFTLRGSVTLSVRRSADAAVVFFDVSDTGVGMGAEDVAKLFAPPAPDDSGTPSEYGVVDLGLAISRKLARAMGGDISVVSEPGKGSTFSLSVPRAPSKSALKAA
jgi:signal transduction histidine kinase